MSNHPNRSRRVPRRFYADSPIGYGGRFHMGSFKRFETIADVAAGCKAFGSAEHIVSLVYGV